MTKAERLELARKWDGFADRHEKRKRKREEYYRNYYRGDAPPVQQIRKAVAA
jgi:hypothetical protein